MVLQKPFRLFISLVFAALMTLQPRPAQPMVAGAVAAGGLVLKGLPFVLTHLGMNWYGQYRLNHSVPSFANPELNTIGSQLFKIRKDLGWLWTTNPLKQEYIAPLTNEYSRQLTNAIAFMKSNKDALEAIAVNRTKTPLERRIATEFTSLVQGAQRTCGQIARKVCGGSNECPAITPYQIDTTPIASFQKKALGTWWQRNISNHFYDFVEQTGIKNFGLNLKDWAIEHPAIAGTVGTAVALIITYQIYKYFTRRAPAANGGIAVNIGGAQQAPVLVAVNGGIITTRRVIKVALALMAAGGGWWGYNALNR